MQRRGRARPGLRRVFCAIALICCFGSAGAAILQLAEVDPLDEVVDSDMRNLRTGSTNHGTGFHVDGLGHAVTAAHVVAGCRNITFSSEGKPGGHARLLGIDTTRDVALLRVDRSETWFDIVARGPVTEELVVFTGAGNDKVDWQFLPARSGPRFQSGPFQLRSFTPALAPGASGGPVLDGSGSVVGMSVGTAKEAGALTLAVGGRELGDFLAYMGVKRSPRRGWLLNLAGERVSPNQIARLRSAIVRINCD